MNEATRKKVLYVLLGLAVVWGGWNFTHPRRSRRPTLEPVAAAAAAAVDATPAASKPLGNIEAKRAEAWGRDPFKSSASRITMVPAAGTSQPKHELSNSGWSLTGILYSSAAPMAFINGRMVKIGDTIDRALVITIDKQKVTLRVDGKAFDLFVSKG